MTTSSRRAGGAVRSQARGAADAVRDVFRPECFRSERTCRFALHERAGSVSSALGDARRGVDDDGAGLTRVPFGAARGGLPERVGERRDRCRQHRQAHEEQRPVADHLAPDRRETRGLDEAGSERTRLGAVAHEQVDRDRNEECGEAEPRHRIAPDHYREGPPWPPRILPGLSGFGTAGRTAQQEFAEAFVERGVGYQQRVVDTLAARVRAPAFEERAQLILYACFTSFACVTTRWPDSRSSNSVSPRYGNSISARDITWNTATSWPMRTQRRISASVCCS